MTDPATDTLRQQLRAAVLWRQHWMAVLAACLGCLALLTPCLYGEVGGRVGVLLAITALLEVLHGFRRATAEAQTAAWASGTISLAMGLLLIHAPYLATGALLVFLAGWFVLDALRCLRSGVRAWRVGAAWLKWLGLGLGNFALALVVALLREQWLTWAVALVVGLRILNTAWTMVLSPRLAPRVAAESVVRDLGLPDDSVVLQMAHRIAAEESVRATVDRGWIISFLLTLLAIHVGRMGFDRTVLGIVAPGFAVLGDAFAALLLAFVVVIPLLAASNRLTRRLERMAWVWSVAVPEAKAGWLRRLVQRPLLFRLRHAIRLRQARGSFRIAISRGLQIGLPLAAIIAATAPMFGMSWYFDTENWAAGIWNSWAAHRTDMWRVAMTDAVSQLQPEQPLQQRFAVRPAGIVAGQDFSFIVIGDTGEGDASQHSLRSQYLEVVRQEHVRFVVLSSDVVYPTGAMKDYEHNFWLPFMGTHKPFYAIPGNHDWYDALEGFVATFFEPEAARLALRARVEADHHLTATTEQRIDELVTQASRLRTQYLVPTQQQQAPYFQFQTEDFALIAVDTGVVRRVDEQQWEWLESVLTAAGDRTKMVILGHPFFAGGRDQAAGDADFQALRALLQRHQVAIIMAGDTHDLEYYPLPVPPAPAELTSATEQAATEQAATADSAGRTVHHFVNGGGGAYLSFGTALDWPEQPVTADWAFFPARQQVVDRIESTIPVWKRPVWFWTLQFNGWPFSAEWLSAVFDSNQAPFYQSFMEVRVESARGQIRLIPYGVHGQLRYRDLQLSSGLSATAQEPDSLVEWTVPMRSAP